MMNDMWILAGDIGTSSVKTAIFDQHGMIVDSAVQAHATSHDHNGWASQEAETWWQGFAANVKILLERHPEARERIAVIGASGHMLGCLPVDGKGHPLYPAIIHADTRASDQARFIEKQVGAETLYDLTGNTLNARSGICKILWLKDHEPELYRKTARFLQSKDYLVSRLTGNPDTTDLSDASHAQWINIKNRTYLTDIFSELDLDSEKMPALHRGTDIIGTLTPESGRELGLPAGIPVIAGAGDGACASVGAGSALSGDFYCCLGTSAWIAYASSQPLFDPQRRLFNILSADGRTCGVYGTVQSAGHSVSWAMNLFQETDARAFDRSAATGPAGSEGLIYLP